MWKKIKNMRNIWEKLENRRKNKWAGGPCHAWAVPCRHATVNVPCRASPRAEASAQTRHGITGRAGTAHRLACRAGPGPATVLPCSGRPGLARPIWPGIWQIWFGVNFYHTKILILYLRKESLALGKLLACPINTEF